METKEHRQTLNMNIWVGNLAAYAGGIFEGELLRLPMEQEEFKCALSRISKNGKCGLFIDPTQNVLPKELSFFRRLIAEYTNPRHLNVLARLCQAQNLNFKAINAYADYRNGALSLENIGNILIQMDKTPQAVEALQLDTYNWEDIYREAGLKEPSRPRLPGESSKEHKASSRKRVGR